MKEQIMKFYYLLSMQKAVIENIRFSKIIIF